MSASDDLPPGGLLVPSLDPRAAPVRLAGEPGAVGVLLCHGFTGSPASMRPWAESLASHGYAVDVPLLPGHGTSWRDLAHTGWEDWYAVLEAALGRLRAAHDVVVVGGLSMGGGLALRLAAEHPDDVAGLLLVNPAVSSSLRRLRLVGALKHVVASIPGIVNDVRREGVDEVGYDRVPLAALHEMVRGWARLRPELGRVRAPLLMFRSVVDHVVDPSSARLITAGVASAEVTERLLTDSWHVATLDHDLPLICEESATFVDAVRRAASDVS